MGVSLDGVLVEGVSRLLLAAGGLTGQCCRRPPYIYMYPPAAIHIYMYPLNGRTHLVVWRCNDGGRELVTVIPCVLVRVQDA